VLENCGAAPDLFMDVLPPSGVLACAAQKALSLPVRVALWLSACNDQQVSALANTLRLPTDCKDMAMLLVRHQRALLTFDELSAEDQLNTLERCDALRRADRFKDLLSALSCLGNDASFATNWLKTLAAAAGVDAGAIALAVRTQEHIAARIRDARIEAIQNLA
jgi:tRNA nucleotidyltransferase (CCA-adding enzyme)